MISLNIEKTFGLSPKNRFLPMKLRLKPHRKRWKTAQVKVMTFWGGCIYPLLSAKSIWLT